MKVLLLHPPTRRLRPWDIRMTPLGLAYLAAIARAGGHTTALLDAPLAGQTLRQVVRFATSFQPDLIGLSSLSPLLPHCRRAALALRPHCRHLVLGGPHVSALEPFDLPGLFPWADYFILGEGEETLAALLAALSKGLSAEGIPGLVGRWPSNFTPRPLLDDLDRLPLPWREPRLLRRSSHPLLPAPAAPLLASRGCPHACLFCDKIIFGTRYRARGINSVMAEVEGLARGGVRSLVFYDDNFSEAEERAAELCARLRAAKLGLPWKCECRVDRVTPRLLRQMKEAGCRIVSFGAESGHAQGLQWLKKGFSLEQSRQAFAWAREAGLLTLGYFILGLPGEDEAAIRATIDFACRLPADYAQFSHLNYYPGSRFGRLAAREGLPLRPLGGLLYLGEDPWAAAAALGERRQRQLLALAYRRFYATPRRLFGLLRHTPWPSFFSPHREVEQTDRR